MEHEKINWSDWLRENSEQYFLTQKPSYAWKGVNGAHNPRLELIDQLKKHYKKLSPREQSNFRKGLTHCLFSLEQKQENTLVFIFLINLASEITCTEVIASGFYEKIIFKGKLGYFDLSQVPKSSARSIYLAVIKSLRYFSSYESKRVAKLVRVMIQQPNFPVKHVHLALLILCKCEPEKLYNHWIRTRRLHAKFMEVEVASKTFDSPVLKMELGRLIDAPVLSAFLSKIHLLDDLNSHDYWLAKLLISACRVDQKGAFDITSTFNVYKLDDPTQFKATVKVKSDNIKNKSFILNSLPEIFTTKLSQGLISFADALDAHLVSILHVPTHTVNAKVPEISILHRIQADNDAVRGGALCL